MFICPTTHNRVSRERVSYTSGGSETERFTERLLWAMEIHEQLICECRSQEAAAASQSPFAFLAPLRFATRDVGWLSGC